MKLTVQQWTGFFSGWKKRIISFEGDCYKLSNKKSDSSDKDNQDEIELFPLANAKIIGDSKRENEITIQTKTKVNTFKFFSEKEKIVLIEQMNKYIDAANEKNAFSEFNSYLESNDLQKEDVLHTKPFELIISNINVIVNYYLEVTAKLETLKKLIANSKLQNEKKNEFNSLHTNLSYIIKNMKWQFDELIKNVYDFKDVVDEMTNQIDNKKNNSNKNSNEEVKNTNVNNDIKFKNDKSKDTSTFTYDIYNFPKRKQMPSKLTVNANIIQELIKAATSKQKSLPVYFNEPISMLQKECEKFYYSSLLNNAAEQDTPENILLYLCAFIIGELSFNSGRILKPFVPLVGETFEYIDNERKFKYIGEEVCRRPTHITAFYCSGDKWKMFGDNRNSNSMKFLKGCVEIEFGSKTHMQFYNKKTNNWDTYVYNKPLMQLKGMLTKNIHYDFTGKITIAQSKNQDVKGELTFIEETKNNPIGSFNGVIMRKGEVIFKLGGNWKREFYYTDAEGNNKKTLIEIEQDDFINNTYENYSLPKYSMNFNYLCDELKKVLPICDSRFRPDQREYENGNIQKAQDIKVMLEVNQVKRHEKYDGKQCEYKPIYFSNEYSENSGGFVYVYKGGYWEDREKQQFPKAVDIFKLNSEIKEEQKNEKNYKNV